MALRRQQILNFDIVVVKWTGEKSRFTLARSSTLAELMECIYSVTKIEPSSQALWSGECILKDRTKSLLSYGIMEDTNTIWLFPACDSCSLHFLTNLEKHCVRPFNCVRFGHVLEEGEEHRTSSNDFEGKDEVIEDILRILYEDKKWSIHEIEPEPEPQPEPFFSVYYREVPYPESAMPSTSNYASTSHQSQAQMLSTGERGASAIDITVLGKVLVPVRREKKREQRVEPVKRCEPYGKYTMDIIDKIGATAFRNLVKELEWEEHFKLTNISCYRFQFYVAQLYNLPKVFVPQEIPVQRPVILPGKSLQVLPDKSLMKVCSGTRKDAGGSKKKGKRQLCPSDSMSANDTGKCYKADNPHKSSQFPKVDQTENPHSEHLPNNKTAEKSTTDPDTDNSTMEVSNDTKIDEENKTGSCLLDSQPAESEKGKEIVETQENTLSSPIAEDIFENACGTNNLALPQQFGNVLISSQDNCRATRIILRDPILILPHTYDQKEFIPGKFSKKRNLKEDGYDEHWLFLPVEKPVMKQVTLPIPAIKNKAGICAKIGCAIKLTISETFICCCSYKYCKDHCDPKSHDHN